MKNQLNILTMALWIFLSAIVWSCNRDEEIEGVMVPKIELDNESGVYKVKAGRILTIVPRLYNAEGATVTWREDEKVVSTSAELTISWPEAGKHYLTLTVEAAGGTSSEEIRVDVEELSAPVISMPFSGEVLTIQTGTAYRLSPEIANSEVEGFHVEWRVDGEVFCVESACTLTADTEGDFDIELYAENIDGSDLRHFTLRVVDEMPYELRFPPISHLNPSTDRYTFVGRPVWLSPEVVHLAGEEWQWSVNGEVVECSGKYYVFTPSQPGEYLINVLVDGIAGASVRVVCVEEDESARCRKVSAVSSPTSDRVWEWIPAPGQFIGDTQTGGMTGLETSHELAVDWAAERLRTRQFVSLGGFGGYIVVGFDHSVVRRTGELYDFGIEGNAFFNAGTDSGGSNEPGIVYVMQDVNGNGLPDDEWYELRGSETGIPDTRQDYAVTYYRPAGARMNVQWTDNYGATGSIDYLPAFHRQESYYPLWVEADSYTLRGTCLASRTSQDADTGLWDNNAYGWGYADNMGSDIISGRGEVSGESQCNGFRISNAMLPDGTPVDLSYIDFIKVQTGVNSKAGWLGETSTEVFGFIDLSIE